MTIDPFSRETYVNGELVPLTRKEFALLFTFCSHPTRTFTREFLMREVWGIMEPLPTRTLDSHVVRLRRKLEEHGVRMIGTVHGVGYRLLDSLPHHQPNYCPLCGGFTAPEAAEAA